MKADSVTRGYNSAKLLHNLEKGITPTNSSFTIMRSHKVKTYTTLREKLFER